MSNGFDDIDYLINKKDQISALQIIKILMKRSLEIMDTTLRDGEQTSGVSYSPEKLTIAKLLLDELKIDRIEVASARVSDGGFKFSKTNY